MVKYIKLYEIYYATIITILNTFPKSRIGVRWFNNNEFVYDVEIPNEITVEALLKLFNSNSKINYCKFVIDKLSINEFLTRIKNTNQTQHQQIFHNYFQFGSYFTQKEDELYYLGRFSHVFKEFESDWYDRNLMDNINFSFHKFKDSKINQGKLPVSDFNHTYFLEIDNYLTNLFICLDGLLKNLTNKESSIINSLNNIKVDNYQRYSRKNVRNITTIVELISHFRDAVSHRETHNNEITKSVRTSGKTFLKIIGPDFKTKIEYGDGYLDVNKQLIPLIKCLKETFIPKELSVFSITDINDNVIFCDLANDDENFPLPVNFSINKIANNIFRIQFPIN